jgi:hypothetical protein
MRRWVLGLVLQGDGSVRPQKLRPNSLVPKRRAQHLLSSRTFVLTRIAFARWAVTIECSTIQRRRVVSSGTRAILRIHWCDICDISPNHSVVEKSIFEQIIC